MQFVYSVKDRVKDKKLRDVADDLRLSAIIKEENKMDAKMRRRAGVNERLEKENRDAETKRKNKEREEMEARAYKWAQQEKLAAELQNIKREEFVDLKLRQQLRETSMELRELESQLKTAYVNKDIAAQLEEKKLAKMYEKLNQKREEEQLEKLNQTHKEEEAKKQQEEYLKNVQYRKELREQVQIVNDEPYQQFLRDKQMMDDIIRLIHEEDMKEREMKMMSMKKTIEEMNQFSKAREMWRERERKATEEEDRRLIEYWMKKDAEAEKTASEEKRTKETAEKRWKAVADHFMSVQNNDQELQKALDELQIEEQKEKIELRARMEMEADIRRKIEAKLFLEQQRRDKAQEREHEKQVDEEFKQELLKKFAEDTRLEQMTKLRRRQVMLDHKKAIEDLIFERKRKRIEEEHSLLELERIEEEQIKMKHKMIEEERLKMLQEHAKNLIGYLPKGLLKPTDFPHVGPEFMEKKENAFQCV